MTTTYNPTQQNAPTLNAEGEKVWKPSVGVVFKPAEDQAHSYGGIIGALQDRIATQGALPKAYPHNFAGIIAAIQDLESAEEQIPVLPGPIPPGTDIDINTGDLIVIVPPKDGQLWFDTRQGRLFVAIDGEWWQTNGADGIAFVRNTSNPPETTEVVPGQFWYDDDGNDLYVFNGTDWVLIADGTDAGAFQTTATLPLASTGPRGNITSYVGTIIPIPDLDDFNTQQDYNIWAFEAVVALEDELGDLAPVIVDDNKPDNPKVGQLWYDTESLEMSVWYEDDDGGQWVPTSVAYTYDEYLAAVRDLVTAESRQRNIEIHALQERLNNIDISDAEEISTISTRLIELDAKIDAIPIVDLNPYVKQTTFDNTSIQLNDRIFALETATPSYTQEKADALESSLLAVIDTKASTGELAAVEAAIPDVSSFTTQADINASIADITTDYLPRKGGTLKGSFVIEKQDYDLPAFDMSGASWHSRYAFKLAANAPVDGYTSTFGTTEALWEYAWNFNEEEDFCWIYNDTNKVFSITKEGPACSTLVLGDFGDNTANGRVIHNKIDVKDRLNTYQTTFEQIRQGVSNATDFDSLKENILSALASV